MGASEPSSDGLVLCGIAGSLRTGSYNRALLAAAREATPEGIELRIFDRVGEIPLYDADVERDGDPEPVDALKSAIEDADALLFASPEYNRGMTGVLKNLIDWASRPPRFVLKGKPAAIMGATPGRSGTAGSQRMLREVLQATGARVMPKPEILISGAADRFTDGRLVDEKTVEYVARLLRSLTDWTHRLRERNAE